MVNSAETLRHLLGVAHEFPEATNNLWAMHLVALGVTEIDSRSAVTFIPLAFGRELLGGMGIEFPEKFVDPNNAESEILLLDVPLYKVAREQAVNAVSEPGFGALASRSPEVDAVNQALNAGANPAGLLLSLPVVLWERPEKVLRPWWKIWG